MPSLNKVLLIGNAGRDPEIRYLDQGTAQAGQQSTKVATFTLATTERYRDRGGELRENTEWHNLVLWRQLADIAERYIRKGSQIYVEGHLRTRSYTDQQGQKKFMTEIVADNVQLLGRREGEADGYAPAAGAAAPAAQSGYSQSGGYQQTGGYQQAGQGGYRGGYQAPAAPASGYQAPSSPASGFGAPAGATPQPGVTSYQRRSETPEAAPAGEDDLPF